MLGEDKYTGYDDKGRPNSNNILSFKNKVPFEGFESITGLDTSKFWEANAKRIIKKLFIDEKYKGKKFDKARNAITQFCKKQGITLPSYTNPISYTILNDNTLNDNLTKVKNTKEHNYINLDIYNYNYIDNNSKKIK